MADETLIYKNEVYAIQGAVFEVYRELGCGFLEPVYQECLEKELSLRKIVFVAQKELFISYKGSVISKTYVPDIICYNQIILEIKAVKALGADHKAQILNYLKVSGLRLGLLVNFGHYPKAQIERFVLWEGEINHEKH